MRHYTFTLLADETSIEDDGGVWFDDRERACDHARAVARELMHGNEKRTRSWSLEVYENGVRVHELLFASVDPTLAGLQPRLRATVEQAAENERAFKEALAAVRATLRESRALVARSRGKPYLATFAGEPTVRPTNETPARKR
jgi:hypothetical protein